MAEYKFQIKNIVPDLKQQSVFIECTLDIDEDSVNSENLYLMHKDTRYIVPFDLIVDRNILQLKLKRWIEPNEPYILFTQCGIDSITGQHIDMQLIRDIVFQSKVLSDVRIISPVNFEEIYGPIELVWKEIKDKDKICTNAYFIEVANDNSFYNILYRIFVDNTENEMTDGIVRRDLKEIEKEGQYFIRVRAQEDADATNYGKWSEPITFVKKDGLSPVSEDKKDPEPNDQPEDFPDIIDLVGDKAPKTGIPLQYESYYDITPEDGFVIKFPFNIDSTEAKVSIVRSDV